MNENGCKANRVTMGKKYDSVKEYVKVGEKGVEGGERGKTCSGMMSSVREDSSPSGNKR